MKVGGYHFQQLKTEFLVVQNIRKFILSKFIEIINENT